MSDNDMIRRGAVLERLDLLEHDAEEREWRDGAKEIARIRRFVFALPAAQPTVKPLDWYSLDVWTYCAGTGIGTYYVKMRGGKWRVTLEFLGAEHLIKELADFEPAFPVAQADYEARILSALDMQPTVSPDVAELPPSIFVRDSVQTEGLIAIRNVDFDNAEMGLCLIPIAHIDGLIAALARVKGVM